MDTALNEPKGRPPLPSEQRRTERMSIRVTAREKAVIIRRAELKGVTPSRYVVRRAMASGLR